MGAQLRAPELLPSVDGGSADVNTNCADAGQGRTRGTQSGARQR